MIRSHMDSSKSRISQTHLISPTSFLFIPIKNLPSRQTDSEIQHRFFELFTIVH